MTGQKKQEGYELTRPSFANNTPTKGIHQRYEYIPLDGFKFELVGVDHRPYLNGEVLDFEHKTKTGGELHYMEHTYRGITLRIYPSGYSYVKGSFHKFSNQGEHNYNDFNYNAFRDVLSDFYDYFKVQPSQLRIMQLEYGFNVVPPILIKTILDGLMQHKGIEFDRLTFQGLGNYKQAEHNRYILKIYDKGKQYGLRNNLLRVETKHKNWTKYRKQGIITLDDLLKTDKLQFLTELLSSIDEVILFDNTIKGIEPYHKYSNPKFWSETRDKRSSKTFNKHRHKLNALSKNNGSNLIERIKESIIQKCNELQGVTNSKTSKKCKLTGVDISTQKEGSFLLSHTGLYYLIENNPKEYQRIKELFLNTRWYDQDETTQVKEIAHNIRSKYITRTKLQRHGQTVLFNQKGNVFQPSIYMDTITPP